MTSRWLLIDCYTYIGANTNEYYYFSKKWIFSIFSLRFYSILIGKLAFLPGWHSFRKPIIITYLWFLLFKLHVDSKCYDFDCNFAHYFDCQLFYDTCTCISISPEHVVPIQAAVRRKVTKMKNESWQKETLKSKWRDNWRKT